jgi:hypothetical protein
MTKSIRHGNQFNLKHGQSHLDGRPSPEYKSWQAMKARITNPNLKEFKNYGGRNINICPQWLNNFETFFSDMGRRPPGTVLDRVNNNGNYEPGNCQWATRKQSGRNRRRVKLDEHKVALIREQLSQGVTQEKIAKAFGVSQSLITDIKLGKTWVTS